MGWRHSVDEFSLSLPAGISSVIIDIGANTDPLLPRPEDTGSTLTLAFEPITFDKIRPAPGRLQVIRAAVSDRAGNATMTLYNARDRMQSSSLSASTTGLSGHGRLVVRTIPLAAVLDAVPPRVRIELLKIDTQGHDFSTLEATPVLTLRDRAAYLKTEVWLGRQNYAGVRNDLCRDFLPYLRRVGYALQAVVRFDGSLVTRKGREDEYCRAQERREGLGKPGFWQDEADAYWQLEQTSEKAPTVGWDFGAPHRRHQRPVHQVVDVHKWLRQAQPGHCGATRVNDHGDCTAGTQGSWRLSALATETWHSAAAECLDRCSGCARCGVISVSVDFKDCSWYAACDTSAGALQQTPRGVRSAPAHWAPMPVSAPGED